MRVLLSQLALMGPYTKIHADASNSRECMCLLTMLYLTYTFRMVSLTMASRLQL